MCSIFITESISNKEWKIEVTQNLDIFQNTFNIQVWKKQEGMDFFPHWKCTVSVKEKSQQNAPTGRDCPI